METLSDEELVRQFIDGTEEVFEELFRRYYKKVYHLCLRFCNLDSLLAEEAAQETFLQVYKSLGRFQFKSSFYTWLYRVTFNTCSIAIKKASRIKNNPLESAEGLACVSDLETPGDLLLKKEHNLYVAKILSELPEEQKQVMILGPIMGYSYQEISEIIGETVTVVKGRLFRARQNFRKKFDSAIKKRNLSETSDTNTKKEVT
jgi:RNA polymerase sigma-70 factor (ECF subfamily)